jgi:hypothetical protein
MLFSSFCVGFFVSCFLNDVFYCLNEGYSLVFGVVAFAIYLIFEDYVYQKLMWEL